jgi:hypothetical protein
VLIFQHKLPIVIYVAAIQKEECSVEQHPQQTVASATGFNVSFIMFFGTHFIAN